MANPILDGTITLIQGEKKNIGVRVWAEADPSTNVSTATASITVYDGMGGVTLATGAATITGTTLVSVGRIWDTTSVVPGMYRALVITTLGSNVQKFQFTCLVLASPAAQTI